MGVEPWVAKEGSPGLPKKVPRASELGSGEVVKTAQVSNKGRLGELVVVWSGPLVRPPF